MLAACDRERPPSTHYTWECSKSGRNALSRRIMASTSRSWMAGQDAFRAQKPAFHDFLHAQNFTLTALLPLKRPAISLFYVGALRAKLMEEDFRTLAEFCVELHSGISPSNDVVEGDAGAQADGNGGVLHGRALIFVDACDLERCLPEFLQKAETALLLIRDSE